MEGHEEVAVRELQCLVEDEKDLYLGNPTDVKVLNLYLKWSYYNVEKAFYKIKQVFRLKNENSDWYAFRRDPAFHDVILKKGIHMLLDKRDQLGRRIYLLKLGNMVYGAHEPNEMIQIDDIWLSLALDEDETRKNGIVFLFDMTGMSWKFLRYFTPRNVKISAAKAESIPLRHVQFHVINAGLLLNTIVPLVFPFLKEATKESVFFHKSKESLHAHISPSSLPTELGGELPPPDPAKLAREYLDVREKRLAELLSYGYTTKNKI